MSGKVQRIMCNGMLEDDYRAEHERQMRARFMQDRMPTEVERAIPAVTVAAAPLAPLKVWTTPSGGAVDVLPWDDDLLVVAPICTEVVIDVR